MLDLFAFTDWATLCTEAVTWLESAGRRGGIPLALFIGGFAAGFSHCTAMCGPFVLMQVMAGTPRGTLAAPPVLQRMSGAGLLPYHFGRLTTYAGLGGVSGGLAGIVADFVSLRWILAAVLAVATAYCVAVIARSPGWIAPRNARRFGSVDRILDTIGWSQVVNRASRLGGYPLGLALGFLPCGLVYAALTAAAATGSAMSGAAAMAAFGLGTVPGLIAVAFAGGFVVRRFRKVPQIAAIPLLVLNVAILSALAFRAFA